VDWIDLAQDRDQCRALVNAVVLSVPIILLIAVINLLVPQNVGKFLSGYAKFAVIIVFNYVGPP
jgi:L-asparagine transporter-like permease